MTASDVLTYLEKLQVQLTLTPDGQLRCQAPRGVLTMVLQGTIKTCKGLLTELLTTGEDLPLPKGVSLPETDYRRFLTWQTGKVPASQFMVAPLPKPVCHDMPGVPDTVLGPPCKKKGCEPTAMGKSGQSRSTYYRRTRLCVRCLCRLKNELPDFQATTTGEDDALRLL
jgi:TubC N-terminal docking domain